MGSLFFTDQPVTDFVTVKKSDVAVFRRFYTHMLNQGVYLAPSAFEAWFVSAAHQDKEIEKTIECAAKSFGILSKSH
jgi:glutamate-1-semialdehyde 2,1-aminomutase